MNDIDRESRAIRAKQILEDPLFIEAFDAVERAAVDRIASLGPDKLGELQELAATIRAVRGVRSEIEILTYGTFDQSRRAEKAKTIV